MIKIVRASLAAVAIGCSVAGIMIRSQAASAQPVLAERAAVVTEPQKPAELSEARKQIVVLKPVATGRGPSLYQNPLRAVRGLVPERIDQGVDYSGTGWLYAIGPGVIEMTYSSGWPGGAFIAERFTAGRLAGRVDYFAEDIRPAVSIGEHVTSQTRIGWMQGGIEAGWAAPQALSESLARLDGQWDGQHSTAYGVQFSWLLRHLGAPGGIPQDVSAHALGGGGGAGGGPAVPKRLLAFRWAKANAMHCPYVYGGNGPCQDGYDCSGLVQHAYMAIGINLPRTAADISDSPMVERIPASEARKGDLVAWGWPNAYHIAIVAYRTSWILAESVPGTYSGVKRSFGDPAYFRVRGAG